LDNTILENSVSGIQEKVREIMAKAEVETKVNGDVLEYLQKTATIVEEVWFVGACPISPLSARLASLIITLNEHMAFFYRKLPFISEELVKSIGDAKVGLSKQEIESFVKRDNTQLMFDCAFVKVFESKLDEMFEESTSVPQMKFGNISPILKVREICLAKTNSQKVQQLTSEFLLIYFF
jgi:hypothetical protein